MKTVIDGVLSAQIPWALVFVGAAFAIVVELLGVTSLPFAVGMYLPVSTMTPTYFCSFRPAGWSVSLADILISEESVLAWSR